jgi:alkylhydroperoxidase family enzyme
MRNDRTHQPARYWKGFRRDQSYQLVPVWRDAGDVFTPRERSALAWAETVTRVAETGVADADYEAAAAEFSDKELADLTYAIGLMNAFNRLGISFRTPPAAAAAKA